MPALHDIRQTRDAAPPTATGRSASVSWEAGPSGLYGGHPPHPV